MLVQKRYFKWNSEFDMPNVRLGQNLSELLEDNLVKPYESGEFKGYQLITDANITIGEKDGFVDYIFIVREGMDNVLEIYSGEYEYPATDKVVKLLSQHFEFLPDTDTKEKFERCAQGDYMWVIFRDYWPNYMVIKRKKN